MFTFDLLWVQSAGACMCSQEYFTIREDRPVVREVTDYVLEHHLFEREYVRQVRYKGEHEVVNTSAAVEGEWDLSSMLPSAFLINIVRRHQSLDMFCFVERFVADCH